MFKYHAVDRIVFHTGNKPVSYRLCCCMERKCELDFQVFFTKSFQAVERSGCGQRNAVCWKIQSVPVAENVYGLNHIVIIKKRFAHSHIDDACDFSAKQNDLLYNL